jgi:dimethylaniline monooxygenase (N-oxide forming)
MSCFGARLTLISYSPAPFKGKRVLVVGIGNTACEVSLSLYKHTSKLYQSYGRGRVMVSRSRVPDDGVPFDTQFTWPKLRLKYFLDHKAPWLMRSLTDKFMISNMIGLAARSEPTVPGTSRRKSRKLAERRMRDDWHLLPCASMAHVHPVTQEDFIPALRRQDIVPVQRFQDFVGEKQVLLADNTVIEVDAVIFCTGYTLDFSVMPELEMNGACGIPLQSVDKMSGLETMNNRESTGTDHKRRKPDIPRLFQMIFPPRWASSIAFLSWMAPQESVWCISELASIAVAQIWSAETNFSNVETRDDNHRKPALLPPLEAMDAQVDSYHTWFRKEWENDHSIRQGYVRAYPFYRFLHDAAGTGMYDNFNHILTGYGWKVWWKDHSLWTWLAKGPLSSYAWRLFDTNPKGIPGCGRKAWPEAKMALKEAVRLLFFNQSLLLTSY